MPTPALRETLAGKGSWAPGLPPRAPAAPASAPLTPITLSVKAVPQPQGPCGVGGLTTWHHTAPPKDSCHPKSVYENFRRWQRFKSLARNYLPQSPDTEALSCFFIPVLRSLARLKPTMTLEEGLRRALHEWQGKSNFDRMIFYDMAAKFMEFEAEEEMQIQKLQWLKGLRAPPPQAPPKLDTQASTAQREGYQPAPKPQKIGRFSDLKFLVLKPQPGPPRCPLSSPAPPVLGAQESEQLHPLCTPRKAAGLKARAAHTRPHKPQCPPKTKAPKEIPVEAVQEYMAIMEGLLGSPHSASGEPQGEQEGAGQEQLEHNWPWPDPALLDYMDALCSQEDFITKVEAVIHPRFLTELLSSEPELDLEALAEELEQEAGLSPSQLVDKRLLAMKEKGRVQAPVSNSRAQMASRPPHPDTSQDALRCEQGPQAGVSGRARAPDMEHEAPGRCGHAQAQLPGHRALALSPGGQEPSPPRAGQHPSPHQGCRGPLQRPGSRDTCFQGETTPAGRLQGPTDVSSEEEEELPSLAFLLASHHSLLPWGLALSPGAWGTPQSPPQKRRLLNTMPPPAAKARKHPLCSSPGSDEQAPLSGSGRPSLALGLLGPSAPKKKRCLPLVAEGMQQHSSQ
ncbi:NUT family member 2D-like [Erinaceus europaeus]|uniref:NUT family member 2D-like n=1 Tax=Erinaceus europaeus TaxID=9365 RepID=A0ABM3Y1M1_ERIEU|nr:NUT family member 2D-like [Erinaceus europaeus]